MAQGTPRAQRAYHHGDLRAALIDEALALLAEAGMLGFSVAQLARRLGVSPASPYRHFPDREGILAAVAERVAGELTMQLAAAAERVGANAAARFAASVGAYTRYVIEHGVGLDLVYLKGHQDVKYVDLHARARELRRLRFQLAAEALPGASREQTAELLDQTTALAHGYAGLHNQRAQTQHHRTADQIQRSAEVAALSLLAGQAAAVGFPAGTPQDR